MENRRQIEAPREKVVEVRREVGAAKKLGRLISRAVRKRYESKRELNRKHSLEMAGSIGMDEGHLVCFEDITFHKRIGEGGFGVVFTCTYKGMPMVAKQFKNAELSPTESKLLANEMRIWSKVQHKNIVAFKGACMVPGKYCLLCEELEQGSLTRILRQQRVQSKGQPFPMVQVLDWACQISSGMTYLHSLSPPIIHRDLKCANILLDKDHTLKISDFGLARHIHRDDTQMTAETGSYRWMAPEVVRHEKYGTACDVYSFMLTLVEMLTCKVPFAELSPVQTALEKTMQGKRPALPKHCPVEVARLITMGWDGDQSKRPPFTLVSLYLEAIKLEHDRRCDSPPLVEAGQDVAGSHQAAHGVQVGEEYAAPETEKPCAFV